MPTFNLPQAWHTPPAEFSLAPFWFWNDVLEEKELSRQMDEFQAHGVDGFVLHPRVGLPRNMGWMSDDLLAKMRYAIVEAHQRGMWVILYDEGMYPSGSSSGQVVQENPAYQCRGFVRINLDAVQPNTIEQGVMIDANGQVNLSHYQTLVAEVHYKGSTYAIVQRPVHAVIRGLHFIDEETQPPQEETPLATDLLNPEAVQCFIRLVYQRYYDEFGEFFGNTIPAIFTDEPHLLGRLQETHEIVAGTTDSLAHVNKFLGYDFTPYLPALWDETAPQSIRVDYERAIEHRFEETYYEQIFAWCGEHGIALTGHPAEPDATRHLRYFHMPGQDIVWRFIEPEKQSALEGRQSTQAKAATSMMLHTNRRRNVNEFCGAYGHDLTFDEMQWLAKWLLIRGCNLLIPHAFYFSVRGARLDERPPDVGLNSNWWNADFTKFARACRRLCWLNTDSHQVTHVAILGEHHRLPWRAAKACFEHQIDFNYLDVDDLTHCEILADGSVSIANQSYQILVVDDIAPANLGALPSQVNVTHWTDNTADCIAKLKSILPETPFSNLEEAGLRVRHVKKLGYDWYILFNEISKPIELQVNLSDAVILNPYTDDKAAFTGALSLEGYAIQILVRKAE